MNERETNELGSTSVIQKISTTSKHPNTGLPHTKAIRVSQNANPLDP